MTKLSELPEVSADLVPTSVDWNGTEITFYVKQVPYEDVGSIWTADLAKDEKRNAKMVSQLVWFDDENGERVPCPYAKAAALPPTLGVLVHQKAMELNGLGGDSTKN